MKIFKFILWLPIAIVGCLVALPLMAFSLAWDQASGGATINE